LSIDRTLGEGGGSSGRIKKHGKRSRGWRTGKHPGQCRKTIKNAIRKRGFGIEYPLIERENNKKRFSSK